MVGRIDPGRGADGRKPGGRGNGRETRAMDGRELCGRSIGKLDDEGSRRSQAVAEGGRSVGVEIGGPGAMEEGEGACALSVPGVGNEARDRGGVARRGPVGVERAFKSGDQGTVLGTPGGRVDDAGNP